MPKFGELVGAIMGVLALVVVSYVALMMNNESAQGALYAVLAASVGFFLRAKVELPK